MKCYKTLSRKIGSFMLSSAMVLGAAAGAVINAPAAAVYADDEQTEPNPIQESYVIDGVTYYNAHSTNFNSNKLYYLDLVDAPCADFGGRSLAQEWLMASLGIKFPLAAQSLDGFDLSAKEALKSRDLADWESGETLSFSDYDVTMVKAKWSGDTIVKEMLGFDKTKGHWVITDKDGKELTGEAPVKLEKIEAGGNTKYTAVKPGTCYLKYVIDEDCYTYSQDAGSEPHYTTNADLKQTAALEVTVTAKEEPKPVIDPNKDINFFIKGSYIGKVNAEAECIEGEDKLDVYLFDKTGKELNVDYSWEARETDGIKLDAEGRVTFTKAGKYHVRAVSGDYSSEWAEITAEGESTPEESKPAPDEKGSNPNTGAAVPAGAAAIVMLCAAAAVKNRKDR